MLLPILTDSTDLRVCHPFSNWQLLIRKLDSSRSLLGDFLLASPRRSSDTATPR